MIFDILFIQFIPCAYFCFLEQTQNCHLHFSVLIIPKIFLHNKGLDN